ncbi:uncharacterized protein LOC135929365 [Gordionus sp. m RMFG-2023]|uniref:uncharacterized protein LOC135929365 n=1 Tax=Gordionus sp. m RMFG-2023 TaxID=3053472 RepID=UPI0031FC3BA4
MLSNIHFPRKLCNKQLIYSFFTISAFVIVFAAFFSTAPLGHKIMASFGSNKGIVSNIKELNLNYHKYTMVLYDKKGSTGKTEKPHNPNEIQNQGESGRVLPESKWRWGEKKEYRKETEMKAKEFNRQNEVFMDTLSHRKDNEKKWRERRPTTSSSTTSEITDIDKELRILYEIKTTQRTSTITLNNRDNRDASTTDKMLDIIDNNDENEELTDQNNVEEEDEEDEYDMEEEDVNQDECKGYHIDLPRDHDKSIEEFIERNLQNKTSNHTGYIQLVDKYLNHRKIIDQIPFYESVMSPKLNGRSLSHRVRRRFEIKIRLVMLLKKGNKRDNMAVKTNAINFDIPFLEDGIFEDKKYDRMLLQMKNKIFAVNDQQLTTTPLISRQMNSRINPWRLAHRWIIRSIFSEKLYEMNKETEPFFGYIHRSVAHYPLIEIDIPNKRVPKPRTRKAKQITVNKMRGSTMKMILELEGNQKVLFKPKRLLMTDFVKDRFWPAFHGRERFQCEIMSYHLSRVLDFRKTPITVGRRFNLFDDFLKNDRYKIIKDVTQNEKLEDSYCFRLFKGKKKNKRLESKKICTESGGMIEGAMIMWLPLPLGIIKNPWHPKSWRKANKNCDGYQMYDISNEYCLKNVDMIIKQNDEGLYKRSQLTILMDIIDMAIYDFLLDNIDRSSFEYLKHEDKKKNGFMPRTHDAIPISLIMIDSGNCFPDPNVDTFTTLAPLYQCCKLRRSTYERLKLLKNGRFIKSFNLSLSEDMLHPFLTAPYWIALERRYNAVMSVIQDWCFTKFEESNVLL